MSQGQNAGRDIYNITSVENSTLGGEHNTYNIQQGVDVGQIPSLVTALQQAIRDSNLPADEKERLNTQAELLEDEVNNEKPDRNRLQELAGPFLFAAGKIAELAKSLVDAGILKGGFPTLPGM